MERPWSTSTRAALALALLARAGAAGTPLGLEVHERTFENGLKVLVHVDRDIPNAVLYTTWRVGSRNEVPGITGLAHYFEHMMFTGGAEFGKSFDPTMEAAGGANNAYTTRDVTAYQDWFPASRLDLILRMEADRMRGMVFDPEVIKSERGVVASERRVNLEEPGEALSEEMWAAAYTAHPYQWPVLGWMVDIENWSKQDLEAFFRRNYAPENATMVLAGDLDPDEVFRKVQQHMGDIPRGPGRRAIHTQEPPQRGARRVEVHHEGATLGQVALAWHVPATEHPDFAVLEVLERMLLVGDSSRLHRLLVEKEAVALSVSGGWQGHQFDPSLFTVEAQLREGKDPGKVEGLLQRAIEDLTRDGPDERELQKVKNGLSATFLRRLRTIDGKASVIAETETFFGGWRKLGARLGAIEAVTADDVKRVLAEHFQPRNRTTAVLVVEAK